MADSKIQQSFGFFDQFSLSTKGRILFLGPAIAQAVLLVGLTLIEIETANFYPQRMAQDREITDALTNMILDNHIALRGIRESLKSKTPPSEDCNSHYQKMLLEEKDLEKYWNDFARRRVANELPLENAHNLALARKALQDQSISLYRSVAGATTASYEEAKHVDDPTMPKSAEIMGSNGRMMNATLKGAHTSEMQLLMSDPGEPVGPETGSRERYLWFTLLLVYSTISLAYLVGFALLFIRSLVRRLEILNENGQRYMLRQELHARLGGRDEIAKLDDAFHDMSEAVQNSTRGHRMMMEKASDLICSMSKGGRVESVSNASLSVLGYHPDELIGSRLVDFIAADSQEKFSERLKAVSEQKGTASFEVPAVRKDGKRIDLLWSITWSSADNSMFCITHDISETKRAERVQQELVQMVSHDLRSPLVAISGFHEFAEKGVLGNLDERGMRQIVSAKRSTQQMLTLVNDLLEAERLDSGMLEITKERTPLSEVFDTAILSVKPQALAKHLTLNMQPGAPTIFADKHIE